MQVVLACGPGRCGSRTIYKQAAAFLASDDYRWGSFHEPKPALIDLAEHAIYEGLQPPLAELRARRDMISQSFDYYLESAVWWSWLLPAVAKLWPGAKIIWLERQLWPFARSAYNRGWYLPEYAETDFWKIMGEPRQEWPAERTSDRWFKLAWYYTVVHQRIGKALSETGLPYVRLSCEALSDLDLLTQVFHWAFGAKGAPLTEDVVSNASDGFITANELAAHGVDVPWKKLPHGYIRFDRQVAEERFERKLPYKDLYTLTPSILESLIEGEGYARRGGNGFQRPAPREKR